MLVLYVLYYKNETFVNNATKKAFLSFVVIYWALTLLPNIIAILSSEFCGYEAETSKLKRIVLLICSFINAHLIFIVYGPGFKRSY